MRLAEHLAALCAWCTRCRPGRCKPDVLRPDIVGMRGSYHNGLKTTAMHERSTPPHPRFPLGNMIHAFVSPVLGLRKIFGGVSNDLPAP